jgi:hypothetical protein
LQHYGDKTAWYPSPKQQATVTTSWRERTLHHGFRSRHQHFYYPFPTSPRHKIKGTSPTATTWQLSSPRTRVGIGPSTLSLASLLPEGVRNAKVTLLLYYPGCTSAAQMHLQHSNKASSRGQHQLLHGSASQIYFRRTEPPSNVPTRECP